MAHVLDRRAGGLLLSEVRHGIFGEFAPYEGWAEPGFERGFYGLHIRDFIFAGYSKGYAERRPVRVGHPPLNEEYFEWVTLLTAVARARGRLCVAEIGAGWGRWMASAAVVARQKGVDCSLVGVEAEPSRFALMQTVLRDNFIDPDDHDLLQAAVSAHDGEVLLAGNDELRDVYGHMIIRPDEVVRWQIVPGYAIQTVPSYSLTTVCAPHAYIDLVDIDVQGAEHDILADSFAAVSGKIGAVHVGTHARALEQSLRGLFRDLGWRNAFDFPGDSTIETRFGPVTFVDGVQTWVNPERRDLYDALTGR